VYGGLGGSLAQRFQNVQKKEESPFRPNHAVSAQAAQDRGRCPLAAEHRALDRGDVAVIAAHE
jgi:hypothetical protein